MRLLNKIAIITGAARGIGRSAAEIFAREGATVIIWDMLDEGEQTAQTIRDSGAQAEFMKISVTDVPGIEEAVRALVEKHGRIDILVNNAGITRDRTLLKMSHAEWQQVMDVNLTGVFNCTKAVVPHMVENGYGRIVNIASIAGKEGNPNASAYSASKAGVIGFTKSLAKELAKTGVTVNSVTPAAVRTPIFDQIPQSHVDFMLSKIPMARLGKVDEVASLVCWLASEECSFSTGAVFDVSGGRATY